MMTLSGVKTILESVDEGAFIGKVAYRAFPAEAAPDLPFICFLETNTDNFVADSRVYQKRQHVDIELYSSQKDPESEAALEATLDSNNLIWDKYEEYIDTEEMVEVVYEVVI